MTEYTSMITGPIRKSTLLLPLDLLISLRTFLVPGYLLTPHVISSYSVTGKVLGLRVRLREGLSLPLTLTGVYEGTTPEDPGILVT